MLLEKLVLQNQECEGNYNFNNKPVCTRGFSETFGDILSELMTAAILLINNTYQNPDFLQVFLYGNKKFWVIADFKKDEKVDDFEDIDELFITFMLPEEY